MSIEDGQKKFAAKRKQRQCHNSCPLISIRVIYYLIQLIFIVWGLLTIIISTMNFENVVIEMGGVEVQEILPVHLSIQSIQYEIMMGFYLM